MPLPLKKTFFLKTSLEMFSCWDFNFSIIRSRHVSIMESLIKNDTHAKPALPPHNVRSFLVSCRGVLQLGGLVLGSPGLVPLRLRLVSLL